MTPNFSCTLFSVSGSAHEKFGVTSRFDDVLFANVLGTLRPKYKIRGVPMGRCKVDTCWSLFVLVFFFCFLLFCFCFCFCFCLFLFLFVRGNVYSVRMLEKITLQGQSVAIRIRQKCQYFQANHKKTQKRIK